MAIDYNLIGGKRSDTLSQTESTVFVMEDGQTVSEVCQLPAQASPVGFYFPATFSGTSITFKVMTAAGAVLLRDPSTGNALSITIGAEGVYAIQPSDLLALALPFLIVSNSAQAGDQQITVYSRKFP